MGFGSFSRGTEDGIPLLSNRSINKISTSRPIIQQRLKCQSLWHQKKQWNELINFIKSREGNRNSFYKDNKGLITIGIGFLVDKKGATTQKRENIGKKFAQKYYYLFNVSGNKDDRIKAVLRDWKNVFVNVNLNIQGSLELNNNGIEKLLEYKLQTYLKTMYRKKSFSKCLPAEIQMALVDARFNSAGIGLYSSIVEQMWKELDYRKSIFSPQLALNFFEDIWKDRGSSRYQERQRWRIEKFQQGVIVF